MQFHFEKVQSQHEKIIFEWLAEPHMQEFWDNSQEHKDDILNFIHGRKEPSNYFNGIFTYWIGSVDGEPFCFILTAKEQFDDKLPELWKAFLSKTGNTYSMDFGIGNKAYIGKGLAHLALANFMDSFRENVDPKANTFFIDPDSDNPRAKHVYEKAGFKEVGEFKGSISYWEFSGEKSYLMIKHFD